MAYELLTDHGFALPLFGTSASANALHVGVPSRPGDPGAIISAFEIYDTEASKLLEASQFRDVAVGDDWIDVFLWNDVVHVGTRAELWAAMEIVRKDIAKLAPLTLFALAEGIDHSATISQAVAVHEWLARDWGTQHADRWRLNSVMRRLAHRELYRHLGYDVDVIELSVVPQNPRLDLYQHVLEIGLPQDTNLTIDEVPNLVSAAKSFGWQLKLRQEPANGASPILATLKDDRVLVMRLRHGRGRTQTQIPLRVVDQFFGKDLSLVDLRTGVVRTMTLSRAGYRPNTMKLQLPGIAAMSDPVARFVRSAGGVQLELYDSSSPEGKAIADLLDVGLSDGSTKQTQGGATWWRILNIGAK